MLGNSNNMNSIQLVNFPAKLTFKISELSEIRQMIDKFVEYYRRSDSGEFSCRILLPRHLKSENDVKRLGTTIYSEIMLSLKKNKLTMNLRDIRYIHDADNYGWLLLNPKVAEKL
jgi:hypothetical protein